MQSLKLTFGNSAGCIPWCWIESPCSERTVQTCHCIYTWSIMTHHTEASKGFKWMKKWWLLLKAKPVGFNGRLAYLCLPWTWSSWSKRYFRSLTSDNMNRYSNSGESNPWREKEIRERIREEKGKSKKINVREKVKSLIHGQEVHSVLPI